ncbi:hypothetical protein H0H93_009639 [Arthromyces matolae]|nr:hypothetical protein H0H93_009639 [Arthromyces matolae]
MVMWSPIRLEQPQSIQQRAIVPLVKGHDVIVQASSGVDKNPQVLIITPTIELAHAAGNGLRSIGAHMEIDFKICTPREDAVNSQIVVGTPGRIGDLLRRRVLNQEKIKFLCVDDLDELLARGFADHLRDVIHSLPEELQFAFFSATMPADVLEFSQNFTRNPVRITNQSEPLISGVKQYYIAVEREEWKLDTVCDLLDNLAVPQAIIFCNTRRKVDWLNEKMHARDLTVSALYADMDQKHREVLLKDFRERNSRILITTDILARGLDVRGISPPVINYDLPVNKENYIHRLARGNLGRSTIAINFVTSDDVRTLRDIERECSSFSTTVSLPKIGVDVSTPEFYNTQIEEMPLNVAFHFGELDSHAHELDLSPTQHSRCPVIFAFLPEYCLRSATFKRG